MTPSPSLIGPSMTSVKLPSVMPTVSFTGTGALPLSRYAVFWEVSSAGPAKDASVEDAGAPLAFGPPLAAGAFEPDDDALGAVPLAASGAAAWRARPLPPGHALPLPDALPLGRPAPRPELCAGAPGGLKRSAAFGTASASLRRAVTMVTVAVMPGRSFSSALSTATMAV